MADAKVTPKRVSISKTKKAAALQENEGLQGISRLKKTKSVQAHGVGRRKKAVARIWLTQGSGKVVVNGKLSREYFDTEIARQTAIMPFKISSIGMAYDVKANVSGGGLSGQADAVSLGIARALVDMNAELKPILRKDGFLTVDARSKERKKYGQKAARRKFQFVKR
jgi:small subunit ribosomal protein S9